MKFIVVTYGTEGDVRPLAALCRALMDAGHEARLLGPVAALGSAQAFGVPATPLAGDIAGSAEAGSIAGVVAQGGDFGGTAAAMARIANAHTEAWMRQTLAAAEGCDAIILSALAAFVGLSVAERLGVKAIGAGFIPITPTRAFPSCFLPPGLVPRPLNRFSHRLVNSLLWRAFAKATNAARATVLGLPPRRTVWTSHPMLYGVSPSILPRPADWPINAQVCGQWVAPASDWTPPAELSAFLAADAPPIYLGFGSMNGFDKPRLTEALLAAAEGRRVVFSPGWSGIDPSGLPANIFVVGDTPHHWLFPRTSLVVHHGGSGTAHSAARAGVPSVVVPFAGDQAFWAERLQAIGVAPAPVPARTLTGQALKRAIGLTEGEQIRGRASAVGQTMAAEDGLGGALAAIEQIMGTA
jgi:sterol 3beta-glucosyltransferase